MTTDEKLDALIAQMSAMNWRLDNIVTRLDKMETRLDEMREYILDFRSETIRRFDQVEARLAMVIVTVQSFDARVPALTKAVVAGADGKESAPRGIVC